MEDLFGVDPSDSRYKLKSSFILPPAPVAPVPAAAPAQGRIMRLDDWCNGNGPVGASAPVDDDPSMPRRAPVPYSMTQPVAGDDHKPAPVIDYSGCPKCAVRACASRRKNERARAREKARKARARAKVGQ